MSKSVLVFKTPDKCSECRMPTICKDGKTVYCKVNSEIIKDHSMKPDWCPMKEMPEKINHPDYCGSGRYDKGWNECIDYILKSGGVE